MWARQKGWANPIKACWLRASVLGKAVEKGGFAPLGFLARAPSDGCSAPLAVTKKFRKTDKLSLRNLWGFLAGLLRFRFLILERWGGWEPKRRQH